MECPLSQIEVGEKCRIKAILAGPNVCQRLQEIGFIADAEVKVITKAFICEVCQAKFGICPELASKIVVEK